jgi:hypothetical protein
MFVSSDPSQKQTDEESEISHSGEKPAPLKEISTDHNIGDKIVRNLMLGDRFASHDQLKKAVLDHGLTTNQVFVLAQGCAKTRKNHSLHEKFPFSSGKFICKHGGLYRSHRTGVEPCKRTNQSSSKIDCPVAIKFKLLEGMLEVISVTSLHNHPVDESLFHYYPSVRKLSSEEKELASEMLHSKVAPRIIATTINTKRVQNGVKGVAIPKDIFNLSTSIKQEKRKGKSEEEILIQLFEDEKQRDQSGVYEAHVKDGTLNMVYIQTSEMRETMEKFPETSFLDSTYRINLENYCLYAKLVMDENGFGQAVSLAFLSDEKSETLELFFKTFKSHNSSWTEIRTIFVDKDFTQKQILEQEFPACKVLLCAFHVMKAMKTYIAKEKLTAEDKHELLQSFKKVLYSKTEEDFHCNQATFLELCSPTMQNYYTTNWGSDPFSWCFAFRDHLRTFGNKTTNRIERFFLTIKTALRGTGNAIAKRLHLSECIEIVLDVLKYKGTFASHQDFRNKLTVLKLHHFPIPEIAEDVGENVTQFAAKLIKVQCSLFLKESYEVEEIIEDLWILTNHRTGNKYEIEQRGMTLSCSCYVNCSFGIPCRHIFVVRQSRKEKLFQVTDILERWLRKNDFSTADNFDCYPPILDAALHSKPDEDILVVEHELSKSNKQNFSKLGNRFKAIHDVTTQLNSEISKFGAEQFTICLENAKTFLKESIEGVEYSLEEVLSNWKEKDQDHHSWTSREEASDSSTAAALATSKK